jgi:Legionella pneumophila major outer membrane protein precursor
MKGERRESVLMRFGAGLVFAALLALSTATPAAAGSSDEVKGWIAAVDLALTQPAGLDEEYAFQSNGLVTPVQGTRRTIDNSADSTFRITGGYSFGLGMGRLEVSYWSFDHGDSESGRLDGFVFPSVFGYGAYSTYAYFLSDPSGVSTSAHSQINADTVDVDYSRAMDVGDNFSFRWLAGLRTATFKEDVKFSGADATYFVKQYRQMNSDAFGLKVGGRGTFGFTRLFSLEGGVALSLLQTDVKGHSSQSITGSFATATEDNRAEDKNGRGQILDVDLKGVWTEGPVSIYLGYSVSSWDGMARDPNPPRTQGTPLTPGGNRDSVSFDSFNVGVIYRFGARGLAPP